MKRALLILAACGSSPERSTTKITYPVDEPAAGLARASQGGNVAAIRGMLGDTVVDGRLWFDDAECEREFAAPTKITGARLDAFAACLAKLELQTTKAHEQIDDLALLTYGPGIEVHARLPDGRLTWIGFSDVRDANDRAPTIAHDTLEALRDAGERVPSAATANTWAWIRVCIDPMGGIASTDVRGASTLADARIYEAAVRTWHFRPFMLGGQAKAVCSMVPLTTRPKVPIRPPPFPTPHGEPLLAPEPRELESGGSVLPSHALIHAFVQHGVDKLFVTIRYCVNERGEVYEARMLRSSGVPTYDQQIADAYKAKRFEPYRDGGRPVAFCTEDTHVLTFSETP